MHGYQITFYTQQDRAHQNMPLAQWLFREAKRCGFRGATVSGSMEGMGHDGVTHAAGWFDVSDQPVQVTMVVTADEGARLLEHLAAEKLKVFYVKVPVEFATLG